MNVQEIEKLEKSIESMTQLARTCGLDFYPMRYEICPADIIYTFGAYGMPTRFSHWSFGKIFHRLRLEYDFGLSRIYELVINSNPCYAFLLEGNTLLQNQTVCAHVLAHCDFFKNNAMFAHTPRDMVERMSISAERIRQYELQYGRGTVESLLDAGLALQEHVDASISGRRYRREWREQKDRERRGLYSEDRPPKKRSDYDDLWTIGDELQIESTFVEEQSTRFPLPQKDIMLFLIEHSPVLKLWQRDVLSILRDEMLYFWPQMETKIMNEGWATYWHLRIMREMDLLPEDSIEFAKMHAGVVLPSRTTINPYYVGLAIWEDIEKRWSKRQTPSSTASEGLGSAGREKMFEVREMENDISFLRNYLTKELMEQLDLYLYQKVGNEYRVVETDYEQVRNALCASRLNGGIPVILVEDGDYQRNGELFLRHAYEGVELDLKQLEKTLPYLYQLWGRTCHLATVVEGREVIFSCDGKRTQRKFV
ncbi:SpoVR family protein [Alicyclobacillus sp. TC]|uniref:SpoVR family protein n=1 Tax=Alicyclobacillus sp. TC TaxID=2606450 RepID=UPI001932A692|nr:SpoVR family protein [Alicyclobacillus sp. TC]QRF22691.1 SpoVR family protein [Alicyclobacillus sp. TC]